MKDRLKNFRSLENIKTKDGRTIKTNVLFRSPSLHYVKEKTASILYNDYHLRTVIDLRNKQEKEEKPDFIIDKVKYYSLPVFNTYVNGITKEESIQNNKGNFKLIDAYKTLAEKRFIPTIKEILKVILESESSILYHCSAGKDRTGIITILLLNILNVDEKIIIKDYLKSARIYFFGRLKLYLKVRFIEKDIEGANRILDSYTVKKAYYDAYIESINMIYGSISNYIENYLDIKSKEKELFIKKFTK